MDADAEAAYKRHAAEQAERSSNRAAAAAVAAAGQQHHDALKAVVRLDQTGGSLYVLQRRQLSKRQASCGMSTHATLKWARKGIKGTPVAEVARSRDAGLVLYWLM